MKNRYRFDARQSNAEMVTKGLTIEPKWEPNADLNVEITDEKRSCKIDAKSEA